MAFLLFWWLGGFGWLDAWLRGVVVSPTIRGLCYCLCLVAASSLLAVPFDLVRVFIIDRRFGLSNQSFGLWLVDQLKGSLIGLILFGALGAALLWLWQVSDVAWLWAWLVTMSFGLLISFLAPALLLPLFYKFRSLPAGSLSKRIRSLADRCQFRNAGVFVIDASRRSSRANAFFTGFGRLRRIALFDTLINQLSEAETAAVLAHEIGHARLGHVKKGLALSALISGVGFFLFDQLNDHPALFAAFGVKDGSVAVAAALFYLASRPLSFLAQVLAVKLSRRNEYEADAFAREACGEGDSLISALQKLHTSNLAHPAPHPLYAGLFFSHPSLAERKAALVSSRS